MFSADPAITRARRTSTAVLPWALLFVVLQTTGILRGQEAADLAPIPVTGLRVTSLSGYVVYFSSGQPEGTFQQTTTPLPSDVGFGWSTQLDWSHVTEKTRVTFTYDPSYTGRLRYAAWNALNHSGAFDAARTFGKWEAGFSGRGDLGNLSEFLFTPTVFAAVAAAPVSFNDVAAAVLTGTFTNAQLASMLTGAPVIESPGRNLFFGERMLTFAGTTYLKYKPSPRLGITFTSSGGRTQHVSDNLAGTVQNGYLIPRTSFASAALDVSYARSERTQVGVSVNSSRVRSILQDVYSTTETASLGRRMGSRWFLRLTGGVGVINPVRNTAVLTTAPQPVGSASLGFTTNSHKFLGSYERTVSDSLGLGANTTSGATGSWRWARPGRSWWIENSVTWQQLAGAGFANMSGWRVQSGFGRVLVGNHIALLTQYVYLHYSQQMTNFPPLTQSAVRVSFVWNRDPHEFQ